MVNDPLGDLLDRAIRMSQVRKALELSEMRALDDMAGNTRQVDEGGMVEQTMTTPGLPSSPFEALQSQGRRGDPLAGLSGTVRRKVDPLRRIQYRTIRGNNIDVERMSPQEIFDRDTQMELGRQKEELRLRQQASLDSLRETGLPLTMNGREYFVPAASYDDVTRAMQLQNEPVMTIGEVLENPGRLSFTNDTLGAAASLIQTLYPRPSIVPRSSAAWAFNPLDGSSKWYVPPVTNPQQPQQPRTSRATPKRTSRQDPFAKAEANKRSALAYAEAIFGHTGDEQALAAAKARAQARYESDIVRAGGTVAPQQQKPEPTAKAGAIIVNRQTGERKVLRGNQWVTLPPGSR